MNLLTWSTSLNKVLLLACAFTAFSCAPLKAQTSLTGAGATFPAPIYQKWFNDYQSVESGVQINYQANGSGGGIKGVTEGTVDFGATDGPMTDDQLKAFRDKHGFPVLHFPTVLGAAVPSYNLPGISEELNFSPEALAGIFLGTIKTWNDPAIAKDNPKVKLPDEKILVVHRSDGSGTTYVWTDYLSKVSPAWSSKVGKNTSVNWPVGLGAPKNDGVAGQIKQQKGAIGYVELVYAVKNHLAYGKVKNASGTYIKADLASVTAAAAGATMPDDFRVSITNAPGKTAYPISTFTWLLIPQKITDAGKKNALVGFVRWAMSKGQNEVEALDYAKLPASVVAKEEKAIASIQ